MSRVLIVIDPGINGAIAVRDEAGRVFVESMPETMRDIWEYFNFVAYGRVLLESERASAFIEDAGYHVRGNNASASCKFARHCGALEMALTAAVIPWEAVRPQKWMKHFGTLPKDKKARKNRIKELMQRRYPNIRVTLANADALAILTWAIENKDS